MCVRFAIAIEKQVFEKRFRVRQLAIRLESNANVTPGMFLPVVVREGENRALLMKWGFVPHWSRSLTVTFSNINARAEGIEQSPAYRSSFVSKRCLIPAVGFYEWKKQEEGKSIPYYFTLKNTLPFAFAGIWDTWKDAEGKAFDTCAIITTVANTIVAPVHPRMPVILQEKDEDAWLETTTTAGQAKNLLQPYPPEHMAFSLF